MESSVLKSLPGNEKGFTLVEALVAMGIFSIVMLATASMLFTGMSTSVSGNSRFIASTVAQGNVDNLMKGSFANVVNSAAPVQTTIDGRVFTTNWVVNNIGATGMRQFTVNTAWTDKSGNHVVTLSGVRAP